MKDLKVKITVGLRKEQHYTIEAEEAHKAYYLFLNPDKRGVFENGVALRGVDIQGIEPDYNSTMGWNSTHVLGDDDWNEIRGKGIDRKLRMALGVAKQVAQIGKDIHLPLSEAGKDLLKLPEYKTGDNPLA